MFAPLVIVPAPLCLFNVAVLPLLTAAAEEDDQRRPVSAKIDPVARAEGNSPFHHPIANRFRVTKVALFQSDQGDRDARRGGGIEFVEPVCEGVSPSSSSYSSTVISVVGNIYGTLGQAIDDGPTKRLRNGLRGERKFWPGCHGASVLPVITGIGVWGSPDISPLAIVPGRGRLPYRWIETPAQRGLRHAFGVARNPVIDSCPPHPA